MKGPLGILLALSLVGIASQAQAGCDAAAGQKLFEAKCTACHSLNEHQVGPSLKDVFGRDAGAAAGFAYTPALEQAGFAWDEEKLDAFLVSPMSFRPGTAMAFGGLRKAPEREAVVCFLKQQGEKS